MPDDLIVGGVALGDADTLGAIDEEINVLAVGDAEEEELGEIEIDDVGVGEIDDIADDDIDDVGDGVL